MTLSPPPSYSPLTVSHNANSCSSPNPATTPTPSSMRKKRRFYHPPLPVSTSSHSPSLAPSTLTTPRTSDSPSDSLSEDSSDDSYFLPLASLSSASSSASLVHPNSHHFASIPKSGFILSAAPGSRRRRAPRPSRYSPRHIFASLHSRLCFGRPLPSLSTFFFCLLLFTLFAVSLTSLLIHILNPDKVPIPWRSYCQDQPHFPHTLADSLPPVDVFVGVFSIDSAYERRHLIRSTYARHTRPLDPHTARPSHNVQLKFILGKPRPAHARRVALEMETFNDIVVLDENENMNRGKTHAYFSWAAENATVPVYYSPPVPPAGRVEKVGVAFKKADYVVKADDDAFIVLSELERHLRVTPREKTYWGYLIRNLFMGGECYALSADLVQYVANHVPLLAYTTGAEDKKVAQWMRLHPNASSINWVTERCWIYDHPKAGTAYSHGFLFPDEVERVRLEGNRGMTEQEKVKRGGELAQSYSTVSRWKEQYNTPRAGMTMEEEVEALVEGGGIWANEGWIETPSEESLVRLDKVWFDANDRRLKPRLTTSTTPSTPKSLSHSSKDNMPGEDDQPVPQSNNNNNNNNNHYNNQEIENDKVINNAPVMTPSEDKDDNDDDEVEDTIQFGRYNRIPQTLLRDMSAFQTDGRSPLYKHYKRAAAWFRPLPSSLSSSKEAENQEEQDGSPLKNATTSSTSTKNRKSKADQQNEEEHAYDIDPGSLPKQHHAQVPVADPSLARRKLVPVPTLRYDQSRLAIQQQRRYLNLPYGGTVVVHFLKRHEWFYETALALLGRSKTWDLGVDAPAYDPRFLISSQSNNSPCPSCPPQTSPSSSSSSSQVSPPKQNSNSNIYISQQPPSSDDQEQVKPIDISGMPKWEGVGVIHALDDLWGGARMWGSPIVMPDGYILEGRERPRLVVEGSK